MCALTPVIIPSPNMNKAEMNAFTHSEAPNGMKLAVSLETRGYPQRVMECFPHSSPVRGAATTAGRTTHGSRLRDQRFAWDSLGTPSHTSHCLWPWNWNSDHLHLVMHALRLGVVHTWEACSQLSVRASHSVFRMPFRDSLPSQCMELAEDTATQETLLHDVGSFTGNVKTSPGACGGPGAQRPRSRGVNAKRLCILVTKKTA